MSRSSASNHLADAQAMANRAISTMCDSGLSMEERARRVARLKNLQNILTRAAALAGQQQAR